MPEFQLSRDAMMFYKDEDFTDPWRVAETVLMLHGSAESGIAWNGWMPLFGRNFRVIRPDMRGFGRSTPMPIDYDWSIDVLVDDFLHLAGHLGIDAFHLVAAKTGGPIALRLAATHPHRVKSLALFGCPDSGKAIVGDPGATYARMEKEGIENHARRTMRQRLGSDCSEELVEGWVGVMAQTALSTQLGYIALSAEMDIAPDLPHIRCPTLVVATEGSGRASAAQTRTWQERIDRSRLIVLPGDSFHVSVTHSEVCARATLDFIEGLNQ